MRSSASFTASLQLLIVSITLGHVSKMEMPHSRTGAAGADQPASQPHSVLLFVQIQQRGWIFWGVFVVLLVGVGQVWGGGRRRGGGGCLWDRWDVNNAFLQEKHLHMERLCRCVVFVCTFVFLVAHLFRSINKTKYSECGWIYRSLFSSVCIRTVTTTACYRFKTKENKVWFHFWNKGRKLSFLQNIQKEADIMHKML